MGFSVISIKNTGIANRVSSLLSNFSAFVGSKIELYTERIKANKNIVILTCQPTH